MKNKIKERRLALNLTQRELETLTGIFDSSLSDYENGKHYPTVENARKLADALQCTIDELYPKENEHERK